MSLFVAGALLFGEVALSRLVAGAILGKVDVLLECNFLWHAQFFVKLE